MSEFIRLTFNFYKNKLLFYLIALCFFVSLTLIKNEGFALLFILFVTTFLIKLYKGKLGKEISRLILLSLSFLPIILWKLFCYSKGIGNDYFNANILLNNWFLMLVTIFTLILAIIIADKYLKRFEKNTEATMTMHTNFSASFLPPLSTILLKL